MKNKKHIFNNKYILAIISTRYYFRRLLGGALDPLDGVDRVGRLMPDAFGVSCGK